MSNFKLWQEEYQKKGIPSSFLQKPSGSLEFLYQYLEKNKLSLKSKTAADLGCGTGRNSFSLVKKGAHLVYALDFVPDLIKKIKHPKIEAICTDLTKQWPLKSNSIDVVIDIFCFKHQATLTKQKFYLSELKRVLKPKGVLLISLAGIDDGYYGSLPKTKIKKDIYKITDPMTKVSSYLYTKESLINELKNHFKFEKFKRESKIGPMHGELFKRETLKFIFKKN